MANSYSGTITAGEIVALTEAMAEVYSADVMYKARGILRYEDFAVRKEELTKSNGETVNFTTYDDITMGGKLTEGTAMETQNMSASQTQVTVDEWGNAIGVTERLLQLSWDDEMANATTLLGRDYAKVRDLSIRDEIETAGSTIFTTPGASAVGDVRLTDTMDIETLRDAVEVLEDEDTPKFNDDFYICFLSPHQAAGLRRDPDWIAAQNYAGTRRLFTGEIGRWEDIIFITTTYQRRGDKPAAHPAYDATLDAAGADGQHLFRASVFGDICIGVADALFVEVRDGGIVDFGRQHRFAWYGMWGVGVLNTEYAVQIISS